MGTFTVLVAPGHGGGRGTAVALVMPTERNLWRKLAKACDISEPLEAVEG